MPAFHKLYLLFIVILYWFLILYPGLCPLNVYTIGKENDQKMAVLANYFSWSEPAPIPIQLEEQFPAAPDICFKNRTLYLTFQTNESMFSKDIYSMMYRDKTWSQPVNISKSESLSSGPRLALSKRNGDQTIHIIWGEQTTDETHLKGPPRPGIPDEILYANNKNGRWSKPVSLFQSSSRTLWFAPRLVTDQLESLNFIFLTRNPKNENRPTIFYIRNEQDSWTSPKPVATMGGESDLASMNDGRLLFVYLRADTSWARKHRSRDSNSVFLKASSGEGESCSESLVHRSGKTPAYRPRIIVDGNDRIHLFWWQDTTGDRRPENIVHTWSDDGLTWQKPDAILTNASIGFPLSYTVQGTPEGIIYMALAVSEKTGQQTSRIYVTSWNDERWETPEEPFDFPSAGQPALAYDANKRQLHMVFRAGPADREQLYQQKLYHAVYSVSHH